MNRRTFTAGMLFLIALCAPLVAQTLPTGFSPTNLITSGLSSPTCFCVAPDGRVFIGQQGGAIRIWKSGSGLLATAFHQFSVVSGNERGLIGLTLDPNYASNRYVYAHLTRSSPTQGGSIVRLRASTANPDVSEAGSQVELFFIGNSTSDAHVGGGLHFGPDGKLYVGVGDQTLSSNAQSIANLFGKVLRLNPDGTIPSDNPTSFPGVAGSPTGQNRAIWALGLRNPFTMYFHPDTGALFINDVGNTAFEEINAGAAGANFGWPATEGDFNQGSFPSYTRPLHAYGHAVGVAIVGGTIYAPPISPYPPAYHGAYFFSDYGAAWIRQRNATTGQVSAFATNAGNPVDMRVDASGKILCLSRGSGRLWRLDYTPTFAPSVIRGPSPQSVEVGSSATFAVVVSASPAPTFQWRRNNVALVDGGSVTGARARVLTLSDVQTPAAGEYDCVVTNSAGETTSAPATLTVEGAVTPADVNCDGSVDVFDIDPFLLALFDPAEYAVAYPSCDRMSADANADGSVDFFDVDAFVACLFGGCD